MDHYYTSQPNSDSKRMTWTAKIAGEKFTFMTDSGVFSKHQLDYGSEVLMTTAINVNYPDGNLLDMGCGYGPIGLFLGKLLPNRTIEMVDMNERALALAIENAELNEVENVEIYQSDLFSNVENKNLAGIISNPPIRAGKKVVHQILEEAYNHLAESGKLLIVIQKKQGAPSARKKMKEVFGNVERINLDKGYWVLVSEKISDN